MTDLKARFDRYVEDFKRRDKRDILVDAVGAAESIATAVTSPGPANVAAACMSVAKVFAGDGICYFEAFRAPQWVHLKLDGTFQNRITTVLEPLVTLTEKLSGEDKAYHVKVGNAHLVWAQDKSQGDDGHSGFYAAATCVQPTLAFLRDRVWEGVHPTRIVFAQVRTGKFDLSPDDVVCAKKSQIAEDFTPYLKRCLEAGVPRNVLFYGPPGTGKSTVTRTLCSNLRLRSLRIRVEDIQYLGNEGLARLVELLGPDVIILDDLDRNHGQASLLETLETFKATVRFVFATVNDLDLLEPALKRPGRFDEIVKIERLDDEGVRALLGEYGDAMDTVRSWPVAYIQEYCIRRRMLGKEKAELAMVELRERIDAL